MGPHFFRGKQPHSFDGLAFVTAEDGDVAMGEADYEGQTIWV